MQATLKRIDPADTPALFKRTGLKAKWGVFGDVAADVPCGCLLTAIAVDKSGPEVVGMITHDYARVDTYASLSGLDRNYAWGLVFGWDDSHSHESSFDNPMPNRAEDCNSAEEFGYLDGRDAYDAF